MRNGGLKELLEKTPEAACIYCNFRSPILPNIKGNNFKVTIQISYNRKVKVVPAKLINIKVPFPNL